VLSGNTPRQAVYDIATSYFEKVIQFAECGLLESIKTDNFIVLQPETATMDAKDGHVPEKKRKASILFEHGANEEEIGQLRADRKKFREEKRAAKKMHKATWLSNMILLHGPHYETLQLEKRAADVRVKMKIVPEIPRQIETEAWSLNGAIQ
jgi:hypothetical protein